MKFGQLIEHPKRNIFLIKDLSNKTIFVHEQNSQGKNLKTLRTERALR